MSDTREVLVNPLLRLRTRPAAYGVTGRSKNADRIVPQVYAARRSAFMERLSHLSSAPETERATHDGRVLVWARMDPASQAKSHTPDDIFDADLGATIVAAWRDGYVVEFQRRGFSDVRGRVVSPESDGERCDIFRIEGLELFATVLNNPARIAAAWTAPGGDASLPRILNVRLAAFRTAEAFESVLSRLISASDEGMVALPRHSDPELIVGPVADAAPTPWVPPQRFAQVLRSVAATRAFVTLGVRSPAALSSLVASGTIARWEPVRTLRAAMPGSGPEPDVELPDLSHEPVVGVIDGGYHANRYRDAVAWRMDPPLVPNHQAARAHGNRVASILVDAHRWSNRLSLPDLHCRIGVVQAVPDQNMGLSIADMDVLSYLDAAFRERPDTHVWNLSANFDADCDEFEVSELGHGLAVLARRHGKLLVVSAGNRSEGASRIAPPADCEAALIVGGRTQDDIGRPAGPCASSRMGFGPGGMLKPETSWFSTQRVGGGVVETGTSYAAPLVSRLAAHTWANLDQPNPDLVKALIVSACDLPQYSHEMGFGSPISPERPWLCAPNSAVVAWTAEISALRRYYWEGIRVPASLLRGGRFVGVAKLVAIHHPVLTMDGDHYVSTRLEAGIQYKAANPDGSLGNRPLAGPVNPKARELKARSDDHKWDPVRVYMRRYTETNGPFLLGPQPEVQVYARMFWRNEFLYDADFMSRHVSRVSFVVTLASEDPASQTYNEFRRIMAGNVETAVVETDVEVDVDGDEDPD